MPGEKAEDGPEVGQLREAWKIPGILWESRSGVKLRAKRNKPHSHFCLFLGRVGHVDNGSFCVCVHCGEQEKEELEQGWERCHRCSRHAPEGDTAGMGGGRCLSHGTPGHCCVFPQRKDWAESKSGSKQDARLDIPDPPVDPKLHSAHFWLQG